MGIPILAGLAAAGTFNGQQKPSATQPIGPPPVPGNSMRASFGKGGFGDGDNALTRQSDGTFGKSLLG